MGGGKGGSDFIDQQKVLCLNRYPSIFVV